jgi:hypothetical protein
MGERIGAERVLVVSPERNNHLEDLGVDGRIILKLILNKYDRGMDWIDLANDRDKWRDVVNTVMNLRIP